MHPVRAAAAAAVLVLLTTVCPASAQEKPRRFLMGFTPFPHDFSLRAMNDMWAFLAANADVVAIHLEHVPWTEALHRRPFHQNMINEWNGKRASIHPGAKVYLAVTPIHQERKRLAGYRGENEGMPLPPEFRDKPFDDPLIRQAYLAYCRRAVEFFKPDFLAIGIESNELFHHTPAAWPAYVALHNHVYDQLKKEHPALPVCASFTLPQHAQPRLARPRRDARGLPVPHGPQ